MRLDKWRGEKKSPLRSLGPREKEAVALIVEGCSNKEIATAMKLTEQTTKVYVSRILKACGLSSRTRLIVAHYKTLLAQKMLDRASCENNQVSE